jgi:TatA/E family protein of Tat protein translocase
MTKSIFIFLVKILVLVFFNFLLLFGAGKLPIVMKDIAKALKIFRNEMKKEDKD